MAAMSDTRQSGGAARAATGLGMLALAALLLAPACDAPPPPRSEFTISRGGRDATVRLGRGSLARAGTAQEILRSMVNRVGELLDPNDRGSDIGRINSLHDMARIRPSRDTYRLLDLACRYAELSGGAFDFTTAPLERLWLPGNPSPDAVEAARAGVGYRYVQVDDDGGVKIDHAYAEIDLHALEPAYVTDLITTALRTRGVRNVLVQYDGCVRAMGMPGDRSDWLYVVCDPDAPSNRVMRVSLGDKIALAQCRTARNVIDPRTGQPASGVSLAVTLGPSATKARALAQALVVEGREKAGRLIANFERCEAMILVPARPNAVYMTAGFATHCVIEGARTVELIEVPVLTTTNAAPPAAATATPAPARPSGQ